jgi:hypothetical protein
MYKVLFTPDSESTSRHVALCYVDMSHPDSSALVASLTGRITGRWEEYENLLDIPIAINVVRPTTEWLKDIDDLKQMLGRSHREVVV